VQLAVPDFKKSSFIRGLYMTGHWTTQGLGISGVVYVGYYIAKMVLRKEKSWN
jgi:phytoene dehydrogenase-like protein